MSGFRWALKAAPSTPAAGKFESFFDSTMRRLRGIDERGMRSDMGPNGEALRPILSNASFQVAQRQVAGTLTSYTTTTGRTYAADRWGMTIEASNLQYARVDTNAANEAALQARFYGRFQQITAASKSMISQVVEGTRGFHLRGRQVRLQCVMKASSAKTIRFGLMQLAAAGTVDTIPAVFASAVGAATVDPTWGTNLALIAPDFLPLACQGVAPGTQATRNSAIDCSATTAWQTFGGIFTVPTNAKNLIIVFWTDSQFSINDNLYLSQVQLLNQTADADWHEVPEQMNLSDCQRYYAKSFPQATAPAQNAGVVGVVSGIAGKAGATALAGKIYIKYPQTMRVAPTVTGFSPSDASANIFRIDGTTPIAHTATAQLHASEDGTFFTSTGTTNTAVGDTIGIHYTANAEL